jgi:hypothetical protein
VKILRPLVALVATPNGPRFFPFSARSRRGPRRWRLLLACLAGAFTLVPTIVSAQGFWLTLPSMPTARQDLAGAVAPCPHGLRGTCSYAIGGGHNGSVSNTVEAYSPAVNAWATLPSMLTARRELAAAAAPCPSGAKGTCVYAVGGVDATALPQNKLEAYSPATNAWATLPSMPTARKDLAAAAGPCPPGLKGTCVYAIGGSDFSNPLGTLEVYSPATNAWSTLASMPTARYQLGGAATSCPAPLLKGTCVYAIGGTTDGIHALNTLEAYSPATNAWAILPTMPTARRALGAAATACPPGVNRACVYAVGGVADTLLNLNTLETYSPAANTWLTLPPMPTARAGLAVTATACPTGAEETCVYAAGGRVSPGDRDSSALEAYIVPDDPGD